MNLFELLKKKGYILFFNQGDRYTDKFIGPNDRPNFFWYHDAFFSHFSIEKQDRFLHLFVKKPDEYNFIFMQGNKTWDDVYSHFLENKEKISKVDDISKLTSYNPPILRCSDTLIPELIFDFEKEGNNEAICIFPDKYKGIRCSFFDDKHFPVDFDKIPKLMDIIGDINEDKKIKSLLLLDLGYKFLNLTENTLSMTISNGNRHIVTSDKDITQDDYEQKTKWSDFRIIIPILFNFYHGLELVLKGILLLNKDIKSDHNLIALFDEVKTDIRYPKNIVDILEKYINVNKIHPMLETFIKENDININDLYMFLRYPLDKKFEKNISYFKLKYKEGLALPYFSDIIKDSEEIRFLVKKYYDSI